MKWYYFSLMLLAICGSWFYQYKAMNNLSEEGQQKSFYVWFFFITATKKYFTDVGWKYRNKTMLMVLIALFGFILGVIITYFKVT